MATILRKRHIGLLGSSALAVAVLSFAHFAPLTMSTAFAGCNSGNVANTNLLADANCQANASGANATAVGRAAFANGANETSVGDNAGPGVAAPGSTNIGTNAGFANGLNAGANSTSLGFNAVGSGANSIAIGGAAAQANAADARGANAIAVGFATDALADNSTAIGTQANVNAGATNSSAFGNNINVSATNSLGMGNNVNIGAAAVNSVAIGNNTTVNGANGVAIGNGTSANFSNSAAFGNGAAATRANQQVFGTASNTYTMAGITSAASTAAQTGPTSVVTTDVAGNLAAISLPGGIASGADIAAVNARIDDLANRNSKAFAGVAMAMAMAGSPTVLQHERFVTTVNYGNFNGSNHGIALAGAYRLDNGIQINAGVGFSPNHSGVAGGRAGVRFGW